MSRKSLNRGDYCMNLACKELEEQGWLITKAMKVQWARQDFFGLWDIIAVHAKTGVVKFIQVSAKPDYDKGRDWRQRAKDFPVTEFSNTAKEYWWRDGKEWKIKSL